MSTRFACVALGALTLAVTAFAGDVVIHLDDAAQITRRSVQYQCDALASKLGLPDGPFQVEYINGGDNSLAVLPISGRPLIFANIFSGSGARYAAQQYIWWEAAGRSITLTSDTLAGKLTSTCQKLEAR